MFDPSRYTIGWVCAIPSEVVAARLHLDTEHDNSEFEAPQNDNNTYFFGSVGSHDIVIATLPRGEYGLVSAAGVARDLIRSFPNVRIGLMVGVGGGAPLIGRNGRESQDIRLGDVVVSTPGNGRGGVCQYDYGKAIQGQGFVLTGYLNSPPQSLLAAVTALETDFEIHGNDIEEAISARLADYPKLQKKYRRPHPASDRLYRSSFAHSDDIQSCDAICDSEEQIVQRNVRDDDEGDVMVHYGLIASASTLMKNALLRDTFARDFGVLCFEMEAAGLMNQLPFLVVRGICDYSDSHKNKEWRGYAAMAAAAYATKLLLKLAPHRVEAEPTLSELIKIREGIHHISNQISQVETRLDHQEIKALQKDVERWLAAPDPSTNHNNALQLRHEGSGGWVLKSNVFQEWQKAQFPTLWLHGISGCGKTVLTSTIIEQLKSTKTSPELVLYFYFDVQDVGKQRLDDMLRSLIKQLCYMRAITWTHLEQLYISCQDGRSEPTSSQLKYCLAEMCKDEAVTIVLDALDECSGRDIVLAWIQETSQQNQMRLFLTSRPEYDIRTSLTKWIPPNAVLDFQGDPLDEDIRAFVRYEICHDTELQRWRLDSECQDYIERNVMKKANGMFRWVVCQMDAIKQCLDRPSLERTLTELPEGLNETYTRILWRIPSGHLQAAIRLLQFLVFYERPLELDEAVDILAVNPDKAPYFDMRNRMPMPHEIAKLCSSLTRITSYERNPRTEVARFVTEVQLAHPSVQEYFSSGQLDKAFRDYFQESRAKANIVQISLAYLYEASSKHEGENEEGQLPFKHLAARYWVDHGRVAERASKPVMNWIQKLLTTTESREFWLKSYDPDGAISSRTGGDGSPLYYASLGGLTESARHLLDDGADIKAEGGAYGSALQAAVKSGFFETVKLLLEYGADVNAKGGKFSNPLQAAARRGTDSFSMLSAFFGMKRHKSHSTLDAASSRRYLDIAKLLLEKGADINAKGTYETTALQAAIEEGFTEMVAFLLDSGADADAEGGRYGNALQAAASEGYLEIVDLLLVKGADIDSKLKYHTKSLFNWFLRGSDDNGLHGTNLQVASYHGLKDMVKLLLEKGADINAKGGNYGTALQAAAHQGYVEVVKLLLENGADVNIEGGRYGNLLQLTAREGRIEVMQLLLEKHADANVEANDFLGLVAVAAGRNHTEMVKLLIAHDRGRFR